MAKHKILFIAGQSHQKFPLIHWNPIYTSIMRNMKYIMILGQCPTEKVLFNLTFGLGVQIRNKTHVLTHRSLLVFMWLQLRRDTHMDLQSSPQVVGLSRKTPMRARTQHKLRFGFNKISLPADQTMMTLERLVWVNDL